MSCIPRQCNLTPVVLVLLQAPLCFHTIVVNEKAKLFMVSLDL